MPVITDHLAKASLASLSIDPARIIVVDNSESGISLPIKPGKVVRLYRNLGVSRSWNIGFRTAIADGDESVTIVSQSVRFSEQGLADLDAGIAGADEWGTEYIGMGWHLNTFTRKFIETMGFFDENLFPAYWEDTDMLYRMGLMDVPSPRENGRSRPYMPVDAECLGTALALKNQSAHVDFAEIEGYYIRKWGGRQGAEEFTTPFNKSQPVNSWVGCEHAGRDSD